MRATVTPLYIFAYGSLIWRPDFDVVEVAPARVLGYERRFWQASHDHRGTPDRPGRVVTLVPQAAGYCDGLVYRLPQAQQEQILVDLDHREQDGYERTWLSARCMPGGPDIRALSWLAGEGNPSWVGEQSLESLAQLIATRRGPSGSNSEYLLRLHAALERHDIPDEHVQALVAFVNGGQASDSGERPE